MESQGFDKIIKENLTDSFLNLLLAQINIDATIISSEVLPALQHTTLKREVDFLARVKTSDQQEFILHLEFQSQNEKGTVYRMTEYAGILLRKYQIPVKQFVVYLGNEKAKMVSRLPDNEIISGFELLSINTFPYQRFLTSNAPEVIIFGILADFEGKDPKDASRVILEKLLALNLDDSLLGKFISQLEILSNLRNLNQIVNQSIRAMPVTLDIRKSSFYQEGMKEGKEEAIVEILKSMHKRGMSISEMAEIVGVSQEYVDSVINKKG